jgi:membrane associated rhomboid family serine protease
MCAYYFISNRNLNKNGFLKFFSGWKTTSYIILINVILFFLFLILNGLTTSIFNVSFEKYLALQANNLFLHGYFWTLLTSMFMHAGLMHLFVNMFSLYFLGSFLEVLIGRKRYIKIYILSGIFAGLFFTALSFLFGQGILAKIFSNPETFAVGASGAIFGLAGVLALLTPKNRVYLITGPLIAIIIQWMVSSFVTNSFVSGTINFLVTIYILISIFSLISPFSSRKIALPLAIPFWALPLVAIIPLVLIGLIPGVELPIGNMAHLGGFIAGAFYGFCLRIKYKKKTRIISEYFSK